MGPEWRRFDGGADNLGLGTEWDGWSSLAVVTHSNDDPPPERDRGWGRGMLRHSSSTQERAELGGVGDEESGHLKEFGARMIGFNREFNHLIIITQEHLSWGK